MTRGRFVVLEGGEASGKTTQVRLLADRLRAAGREVETTFEPGGTDLGGRIRALLLDGTDDVAPLAEVLLLAADRAQHVRDVVRPALERGMVVVSDRFVPSSLAYQGVGRGVGVEVVEEVNVVSTGGLEPDVVVVIDLPDDVAALRRTGAPDRMEREGAAFHGAVRQAYRDLAAARSWVVVNGSGSIEDVADRVWAAVAARLGT
ncbi:MAG TPA: dTMP kinase [Acidimicrobiia bacterium]